MIDATRGEVEQTHGAIGGGLWYLNKRKRGYSTLVDTVQRIGIGFLY